ncbi:unnamed protein product [Trifolium pratense]|uniref:Uncharacterized protein n=1 Tax=Trifolium pratense TaxID=57577 RepID=A0ACB0KKN7_TRIPR|nr:unnamed protein product [Trifolium pratense]
MAMTLFNGFYLVVTIMISFSLFFRTSLCSEITESPSYAPKPLSSYEKYLSECASKLKPQKCGKQIFKSVFIGKIAVSNKCCHNLVNDVGKTCHFDMTKYLAESPKFAKHKKQILHRAVKVWHHCTQLNSNLVTNE